MAANERLTGTRFPLTNDDGNAVPESAARRASNGGDDAGATAPDVRGSGAIPASPEAGETLPLTAFMPDDRNANVGTSRGRAMVEDSLRHNGAGRSILVDRNGRIIAGNTTHEAAVDIGLTDAVVVRTDGTKLVVVQRTDLDLDSPAGRALAVADNRAGEVGLQWDSARLAQLAADDVVDLSSFFSSVELADLLSSDVPVPDFAAVSDDVQGRLDTLKHAVTCPQCGATFTPEGR
jgi:hypothetical protein